MIKELEKKAYEDLINRFWDESKGDFSFSLKEPVSSPSITSVCLLSIKSYGSEGIEWINSKRKAIEQSLCDNYPWMDAGKHYQNNMAMSFGYIGLKELESNETSILKHSFSYLKEQQNEDGGWHFSKSYTDESVPYFTYWALRCFLYEEPTDDLWMNTIYPALNFLVNSLQGYSVLPTSYCLIKHAIKLISDKYSLFFDDELKKNIKKIHEYKIERHQLKTGIWKSEPAVISNAYFTKSLFTLKNLYFLSELKYKLISDQYQKMFEWINKHYSNPGWPSDSEISKTGVSWVTAYILLGLTSYRKSLLGYIG